MGELFETDTDYLAALEEWTTRMAGFDSSVTSPHGALDLAAERADEFPTDTREEHSPWTCIISDDDLEALIEFERAVYEADSACGIESGRFEAERATPTVVHRRDHLVTVSRIRSSARR